MEMRPYLLRDHCKGRLDTRKNVLDRKGRDGRHESTGIEARDIKQPLKSLFMLSVVCVILAAAAAACSVCNRKRFERFLLGRVLLNLVSNAVRYTSIGGVIVGCRRIGFGLRIDVCDHPLSD